MSRMIYCALLLPLLMSICAARATDEALGSPVVAASEQESPLAEAGEGGIAHGGSQGETGHDAEHDATDLSHANASPRLHDPSELRFDLAICTFIVFLTLLAVLRAFVWRPIMRGLDHREESIRSRIENANRASEEAEKKLQEYEAKLAAARQEAQAMIGQARKDAEAVADQIREEAKADAARLHERVIADIEAAQNEAVRDVARQSADLAVLLAGRIVRRELKPEDHAALITEALERFPSNN